MTPEEGGGNVTWGREANAGREGTRRDELLDVPMWWLVDSVQGDAGNQELVRTKKESVAQGSATQNMLWQVDVRIQRACSRGSMSCSCEQTRFGSARAWS